MARKTLEQMQREIKGHVLHGVANDSEFMLCGLAFDAYETGDEDTPVIVAKPGELVTCENCRGVIDHVRNNFHQGRYRYRPNTEGQTRGGSRVV